MIWVGNGCLSLGGGRFVHYGAEVPAGALAPEDEIDLVAAGWLVNSIEQPAAKQPQEPELRVRVQAKAPESKQAPEPGLAPDPRKSASVGVHEKAWASTKKRKRGRPRKKKVTDE